MTIEVYRGLGTVAEVLGPRVLPPDVPPQDLHLLPVPIIGGQPRVNWTEEISETPYIMIESAKSLTRNAQKSSQ